MFDKIKRRFKEKKFFIILLVFFVIAAVSIFWWTISSQQINSPDEIAAGEDKFTAQKIAENYKGRMAVSLFKEKLEDHKIEKIWRQYREKEREIVIYYVKIEGEDSYYLVRATQFEQFLIDTPLGKTAISLDTQLSMGERVFYGKEIFYDILTTTPKLPVDNNQYIIMGVIFAVFIFFLWFLWARMPGGGLSGFSRFRKHDAETPTVTFDEIAGIDEAKREFREVIDFFKNRENYEKVKARIPKGVLLIGPPGCGKTMMAEAASNELGASYLSLSGSELVEMFVGVGAARVRDLFNKAKQIVLKTGLCLLFIDEVDALGAKRGARLDGSSDERQTTTNEIMIQMDGIGSDQRIIVIAATNRPDILDEAFMRPGRFDRKVIITHPNVKGREAMLRVHTKSKPLADDVDFAELARAIPLGSSGADIANIVNEAAILAGRHGKTQISMEDFKKARDKIRFGLEKEGDVTTDIEKKSYAYHEAGHALVAKLLPGMDPLSKVSIVSRGMTHGLVEITPKEDRNIKNKQHLLNEITIALASVAAEEEIFGEYGVTTGASSDIEQATKIATAMVSIFGMSGEFGLVSLKALMDSGINFPSTKEIMNAVNKINSEAKNRAMELIRANRKKLDALAEALIALEDMDGKTAEEIIEKGKYPLE